MNNLERLTEQARVFAEHHIPTEAMVPVALAVPIVMIVVGLVVAVLGAKLARPCLTTAFGVSGAIIGGISAQAMGVSVPIGVLVGVVVMGVCGFVLHRLWVGMVTCALLSAVAIGIYGSHGVLPHLADYAKVAPEAVTVHDARFTTDHPTKQAIHLNPEFKQWAKDFWQDVTSQNTSLQRNLSMVAVSAGLLGLLLGLVAVRLTLVVLTSVVGTALFTSGATALAYQFQPEFYDAGLSHPHALGLACGTFLVGSLVLQALLTRSEKSRTKTADKA